MGVSLKPIKGPALEQGKMESSANWEMHTHASPFPAPTQWILDSPSPEHSSSQFSAAFQIMFN